MLKYYTQISNVTMLSKNGDKQLLKCNNKVVAWWYILNIPLSIIKIKTNLYTSHLAWLNVLKIQTRLLNYRSNMCMLYKYPYKTAILFLTSAHEVGYIYVLCYKVDRNNLFVSRKIQQKHVPGWARTTNLSVNSRTR